MHLLTSTTTAMPMTQFTTFTVRNSWEKWWVTGTSIVIEQCKCWYSIFYLLFICHIFHHERLWGRAGASRSRTFSAWDGAERFDRLQLWLEQIKIVFKISSEFSSNVGIPVFLKIVFQKLESPQPWYFLVLTQSCTVTGDCGAGPRYAPWAGQGQVGEREERIWIMFRTNAASCGTW